MILTQIRDRARTQSGFSLVELLVVILIIGILATLALPRFLGQRDSANNSKPKTTVRSAVTAAEAYYAEGQTYTGWSDANLKKYEPALSVAGGATPLSPSGCVGGGATTGAAAACAKGQGDPNVIYIAVIDGPDSGTTADDLIQCANGKGSEAYCVLTQTAGAAKYGKGATVGAAYTAAVAAGTGNEQAF